MSQELKRGQPPNSGSKLHLSNQRKLFEFIIVLTLCFGSRRACYKSHLAGVPLPRARRLVESLREMVKQWRASF